MSVFGLLWFPLFNHISNFVGYLMLISIIVEEPLEYYLTHSWTDRGCIPFPRVFSPKINAIAQLENELTYYNVAVQQVSYYA